MARKSSPTILQEELYPPPGEPERELDDARLVDLDVEEESPFLRGQKRVSARRSALPSSPEAGFSSAHLYLLSTLFNFDRDQCSMSV